MGDYGWKFVLDGTVDITDKVLSFNIESSLEMFCRELSLELADETFYDALDFSIIPESPRIEVFTRTNELSEDEYEDEYDPAWISQGEFFIERPTFRVGLNETTTGIWGRQSTAIMGEPFAQKITKLWVADTTFYNICEELLESVGLTWDENKCDLADFYVYADNFEADNELPIEVLKKLVNLAVGAEGFVTCDRQGDICIRVLDRAPTTSDVDITDLIVQSYNEEPEWPEFGNRIKITPAQTTSQNSIEMSMDSECMGVDGNTDLIIYAQVKNGDSVPINNAVVEWFFEPANAKDMWFKYPHSPANLQKTASQNTQEMLIPSEIKRASGVNSVSTEFEASSILGIWAYSDKSRSFNYAANNGYVIDGKTVYLTLTQFNFCDQMVVISYMASGMVKNVIVYDEKAYESPTAVQLLGEVNVIASVSGRDNVKLLYVDNSCKCKTSMTITANPTTISTGQSVIDVYVENGGCPANVVVHMLEVTGNGYLAWADKATETITITGEKTEVVNDIFGQSQCVLSCPITTVTGIWLIDAYGQKTGSNLYSSFVGRIIDLNAFVATGTEVLVDYTRGGSVRNYLKGSHVGDAQVNVSVDVDTEQGLTQSIKVSIVSDTGTGGGETKPTVYVEGPIACVYANGGQDIQRFGPYNLYMMDPVTGTPVLITQTKIAASGSGYLQIPSLGYFSTNKLTPSQSVSVSVQGVHPRTGESLTASLSVTYTGGVSGTEITYNITGPLNPTKTIPGDQTFGPYYLCRSSGEVVSGSFVLTITSGSGFVEVVNNSLKVGNNACNQSIGIRITGEDYVDYEWQTVSANATVYVTSPF